LNEAVERPMDEVEARVPSRRPARRSTRWRLDAQTARLASGLVLLCFALGHFINHALGLVSLAWMDEMQTWRWLIWRSAPGTALLFGAFAVHIVFGLWKVVRRSTWRMPAWEAAQIGLGLLIPVLLYRHVLSTRGMTIAAGTQDFYADVLRRLWPEAALQQSALILIVWIHAMIGLRHWLRIRSWYARAAPWLLGVAVLVPTLAIAGWIVAARRLALEPDQPPAWTQAQLDTLSRLIDIGAMVLTAVAVSALAALAILKSIARLRNSLKVRYAGGRAVKTAPGPTLLEISRANGVPHAAICGGRARCTTCRVLVVDGAEGLDPPSPVEARALARIAAPEGVRLACQIRPRHDITVRPLVPIAEAEAAGRANDPYRWGVERRITVLFADLRGFTSLAERLYPYDSVFLLNRYFEVMTGVIRANGGVIDKFMGDGIMALFGVSAARGAGSRDAILSAKGMSEALTAVNDEFHALLTAPLRMGLGVHTGPAVLGRVGTGVMRSGGTGLTALGDMVNTASRLESLTKDFGALAVISDAAFAASGLVMPGARMEEIAVRGREQTIRVHVVADFSSLTDPAANEALTT